MRKLSLLLVEGDVSVRKPMADALRARYDGARIDAASSLAEALTLTPQSRDLVLTEWVLPDACGKVVIETLTDAGASAIIVVTASHDSAVRPRGSPSSLVTARADIAQVAAEAVLAGAADFIVRHTDFLQMLPLAIEKNLATDKLRRERNALHRQLRDQNETLEQLLKSLAEAAATDPLTGLYNRRHFAAVLEQMFADALRAKTDLACVMLDMDAFKQLNDTFGHQAGDAALVTVASNIQVSLRKMDASARYGGDEFVLLLPRSSCIDAANVARRIRASYVEQMRARGHTRIPLGLSFGVASLFQDQPRSPYALVAAADQALYTAKRLGRDAQLTHAETTHPSMLLRTP